MSRTRPLSGLAAFSLVEVALAMAILAVGMVGVMSLLPVGLDSARQVHNETVATLIARTEIGNIWLSNMAQTGTNFWIPPPGDRFFDQDGQTNSNLSFQYFRLQITNISASTASPKSCRYFLTLQWPKGATNQAAARQKRVFVTEVVKP